jgi:hypothetical protein
MIVNHFIELGKILFSPFSLLAHLRESLFSEKLFDRASTEFSRESTLETLVRRLEREREKAIYPLGTKWKIIRE